MADRPTDNPMRIRLSDEARTHLVARIEAFFAGEFDRTLSDFQANRMLDFFVRHLGAPVYNQAIRDARVFLQEKLDDLEGDVYEPEDPADSP